MSEQIIEVLEYLGEKLGIAIDWTTENIMPYVEELFKRYTTLKITTLSIGVIIGMTLCIIAIVVSTKLFKGFIKTKANKKNTLFWEHSSYCSDMFISGMGIFAVGIIVACSVFGIALLGAAFTNLLEWIFIPEVSFVKEIADLIK